MEMVNNYYHSQLEAIQNYYHHLQEKDGQRVSMTEAIINWFTDGHAEQFRQDYLRKNSPVVQ